MELKRGEVRSLSTLEFKPVVGIASLSIEGATPDAEVWIDGRSAGATGHDGSFKHGDISPAEHPIMLRKADFEEKQLFRTFGAGQTAHIAGSEGQLTPFGAIDFKISPLNAKITYQRVEDPPPHPAENGRSVHVKAGRYLVIANAAGTRPQQETVSVEPGRSLTIDWTLASVPEEPKKAAPVVVPKQVSTPDYFQDPTGWNQSGSWWIHKGDSTSWLRSNQGTFSIEFLRQITKIGFIKRTKHVEFIFDQQSPSDFVDYIFDFNNLERRVTIAGRSDSKKMKLPAAAGSAASYVLQIDLSPEGAVIRDPDGQELDRYQRSNRATPLGKAGFKGDVALTVRHAVER